MAAKQNKSADKGEAKVTRLSEEELAQIEAAVAERGKNDLERSGRSKTKAKTQTKVVDRTNEPARKSGAKVKSEQRKLDNGTVLKSRR